MDKIFNATELWLLYDQRELLSDQTTIGQNVFRPCNEMFITSFNQEINPKSEIRHQK